MAELTEPTQQPIYYNDLRDEGEELPWFHSFPEDDCSEYKAFINEFRDNKTWGYVVFRTIYGPETDDNFKSAMLKVEHGIREFLERPSSGDPPSPHPGERQALIELIMSHYQNIIIEDETLDKATISTLQERFHLWLTENERHVEGGYCGDHYFIVVDQECLDSLSEAPMDALKKFFDDEAAVQPMLKFVSNEGGHVTTQEAWWLWEHFFHNTRT